MEINQVSLGLKRFLIKNNWKEVALRNNDKFFYLKPNTELGFPKKYILKLPNKNNSRDFYLYMKNILELLLNVYPKNKKDLLPITELNENLKHRYSNNWIIPEEKSRIRKMDKNEIYLPGQND